MEFTRRNVLLVVVSAIALVVLTVSLLAGVIRANLSRQTGAARATHVVGAASPTLASSSPATQLPIPAGMDWTQYRFDITGTGVNPEGLISSRNIGHLQPTWVSDPVVGWHPFESTPAVVGDMIYITAGRYFRALDLRTGAELWQVEDVGEKGTMFSSVAVDPHTKMAYYGSSDGRLFAINLVTHQMAWFARLGDASQGANIWSSPLLVNGKVYVGLASTNDTPCVRGAIFALDPATGVTDWVHYTAPEGALGGAIWSSLTADPDAHQIIATTGNPCDAPGAPASQSGVVTPEEDAIVALDWNTGQTVWSYSTQVYDFCDCDFGEGAVIYTYQGAKYVVAGNKMGNLYALTPPSAPGGAPALAWMRTLAQSGFLGDGGIFQPPTYANGMLFIGGGPTTDSACQRGALWGLRADTGDTVWRTCTPSQLVGASAVSGDVLIMGMQDTLVALALTTGTTVWQASQKPSQVWGGTTVSHGFVISPTVGGPNGSSGRLFAYRLPVSGP